MTTEELLQGVLDLWGDDPSRWTIGALARNAAVEKLEDPSSPEATCWCVLGAMRKVLGLGPEADDDDTTNEVAEWNEATNRLIRVAREAGERWGLPIWNDTNDFETVVAGVRKALTAA